MLTLSKAVLCTALVVVSCAARAGAINVLLDVESAVSLTAKSIAATYARTGHAPAAPPLRPGGCVKTSPSGDPVNCDNSDFFSHPVPPGPDVALAHADAVGFRLLLGNVSTNAVAMKGDFAVAAAFAKAGIRVSTSPPAAKFTVGGSLGPLTLTASLDPGISYYTLQISDLAVDQYNQDILPSVLSDVLASDSSNQAASPAHVFYDLRIAFNATTGEYSVVNTSDFLSAGVLLTDADFVTGLFPTLDPFGNTVMMPGITLRDAALGNFSLDLPSGVDGQNVSADAMQLAVAVPEPGTLPLFGIALGACWLVRRRRS